MKNQVSLIGNVGNEIEIKEVKDGVKKAVLSLASSETYKDKDGFVWFCDRGVDPDKDFGSQGRWRVDLMQFDRND